MCNCGKKRMLYMAQSDKAHKEAAQEAIDGGFSKFEYTGKTALTVTGNQTGRIYRFARPGDILFVDNRDAGGMTGISVLKRVLPVANG